VRRRPLISLSAATGLLEAIEAAGVDPDSVLRPLGLSRSILSKPDGFIACSDFTRILDEAVRATGDDCFGLHFGERYNPKDVGPVTYVMLNSPTMAAGLQNMGRYLRVHNEGVKVSFDVEGRFAYARHLLVDPEIEAPRQHNEYSMAMGLNLIRLMGGSHWVPLEVLFAHEAPGQVSEHARIFGAPVSFGSATNTFVIEREFLERQVPAADRRLYPILRRYLDQVLTEMPREDSLLATVRRALGESLRDGDPALEQVARKVAMGPRTLQRQLKEHGVGFKTLVDDTRRRFAVNYLRDRQHTLAEIAYLLGYSEVSAFNRAFKRWTGSTPSGHRRRAIG
jgi:AraC-like DNA-binding protein